LSGSGQGLKVILQAWGSCKCRACFIGSFCVLYLGKTHWGGSIHVCGWMQVVSSFLLPCLHVTAFRNVWS